MRAPAECRRRAAQDGPPYLSKGPTRCGTKCGDNIPRPRPCVRRRGAVRLRIVNRNFDFHSSVIYAAEPLGDLSGIGHGGTAAVEPHTVREAGRFHNENVLLPLTGGVTLEGGDIDWGQWPSIGKYLPVRCIHFSKSDQKARDLDDFA